MNENRRSPYESSRRERYTRGATACAVAVTAAALLLTSCTSKDGGNVDTNTMKETTTQRVPGTTITTPVTDNVHDNQPTTGPTGTTPVTPGTGNADSGKYMPNGTFPLPRY